MQNRLGELWDDGGCTREFNVQVRPVTLTIGDQESSTSVETVNAPPPPSPPPPPPPSPPPPDISIEDFELGATGFLCGFGPLYMYIYCDADRTAKCI